MANEEEDPFAFIIDSCRYSSSQEELLSHSKFAREDEVFPDEKKPSGAENSGGCRLKVDGADQTGGGYVRKFSVDANSVRAKNLGFQGEKRGPSEGEASGTKLVESVGGKSEIEPQLKKSKVDSVIRCSGKMVIEGKDEEKVVMVEGDLKVEMASASGSGIENLAECTEKLNSEVDEDDVHIGGELSLNGGGKKEESFQETELIDLEGEEENQAKCKVDKKVNDHGGGNEKMEENANEGDDRSKKEDDNTRLGKRKLPDSMFGLTWDEGTRDRKRNENKVIENEIMVDEIKDASVEEKRVEKPKGGEDEGEALKRILNVLRVIVGDKCLKDDTEIDIFETVKRRGMTFPRSRFLQEVEE
ncbi:uncharacterized protein LOC130800614 [Amaranthus tricolor]|uniref:uncharacterized protein LOC130800614 n=1 Tax=Amaranthus tricolor TaxID=29722 RepID=UPI0025847DD2|nr:uncharacterized protein LOC130800614 [Amaranthus tricolor]